MQINQTITSYPSNGLFSVNIGYDYEENHTYNVYVNTSTDDPDVVPSELVDFFELPFDNISTYEEAYLLAQLLCQANNLEFAGDCGSCPFVFKSDPFLKEPSSIDLSSLDSPDLFICFNNKDKDGFFIFADDYKNNSTPIIIGGYYPNFESCFKAASSISSFLKIKFLGLKHLDVHNFI